MTSIYIARFDIFTVVLLNIKTKLQISVRHVGLGHRSGMDVP